MMIDNEQEKPSRLDDYYSNTRSNNTGFANKTNPRSNLTYKKYKKLVNEKGQSKKITDEGIFTAGDRIYTSR